MPQTRSTAPFRRASSRRGRASLPRPTTGLDVLTVPLLVLAVLACAGEGAPPQEDASLTGVWRAVLASPGGELPFGLEIQDRDGALGATIHNAEEVVEVELVEHRGDELLLAFDGYDSEIVAGLQADGSLRGRWRKTAASGDSTLDFSAVRGIEHRFTGSQEAPGWSVGGEWATTFVDEDGTFPARGLFDQQGDRVTGTFRTTTGDYRYLEGEIEGDELLLSTFDGAHAFLFRARRGEDGVLRGDFWSRDSYHATFEATPAAEGSELPDAWQQVGLANPDGRFTFSFPDLDGELVSSEDERFRGRVLLVDVFGSWCPNCNDSAPLLAEWHREYEGRGLEVVGLAFEMTGDAERDRRFVRRFGERHGIEYPLLLAGTSDKEAAAEQLPDLDAVLSFPTKIFVDRSGRVRRIHSGFDGPSTGASHDLLVAELRATIEELLDEPAPAD